MVCGPVPAQPGDQKPLTQMPRCMCYERALRGVPAVREYRAKWAVEALGVDGAAALMRGHAAAERQDVMNMASRFRGVSKDKKSWHAYIQVTENGKNRRIRIGYFAREEDAARARDRVSIAKLGHAEAKTNFPVAGYRSEWAELEAVGVDTAVARERQRSRVV